MSYDVGVYSTSGKKLKTAIQQSPCIQKCIVHFNFYISKS